MADKIFENNQVSIVGEIVSDFRFSHEVYGEGFYVVDVSQPAEQFYGLHTTDDLRTAH